LEDCLEVFCVRRIIDQPLGLRVVGFVSMWLDGR
jgi:hypothetical protein